MATVAVFLALGGGAYAAVKITGRDVVNRSLTGKDIKKRSVPLNRLKGRPARGRRGEAGPQGRRAIRVRPDPWTRRSSSPPPAPPRWRSAQPSGWRALEAFRSSAPGWMPTGSSGRRPPPWEPSSCTSSRPCRSRWPEGRHELVAATLCYSTTEPQVRLTAVFIDQFGVRSARSARRLRHAGEFDGRDDPRRIGVPALHATPDVRARVRRLHQHPPALRLRCGRPGSRRRVIVRARTGLSHHAALQQRRDLFPRTPQLPQHGLGVLAQERRGRGGGRIRRPPDRRAHQLHVRPRSGGRR